MDTLSKVHNMGSQRGFNMIPGALKEWTHPPPPPEEKSYQHILSTNFAIDNCWILDFDWIWCNVAMVISIDIKVTIERHWQ